MKNFKVFNLGLFLHIFTMFTVESRQPKGTRDGKFLGVFQVVKFPNDPCPSPNPVGTCFTADECSSKGGTNLQSCAQGYGVCCGFTVTCGGIARENHTVFASPGQVSNGVCNVRVCPATSTICQLRLDFESFSITGPSTSSGMVGKMANGVLLTNDAGTRGVDVALASRCLVDSFVVSSPGNAATPAICGVNNGQHMYVASSSDCNDLRFDLRASLASGTSVTRSWRIRITQHDCRDPNKAPDGCTQWFFGNSTGFVQTFNYDGGQHLANQEHNFCIRREANTCRICWNAVNPLDFDISGPSTGTAANTDLNCCNYGKNGDYNAGATALGYDCALIPGALFGTPASRIGSRFCGRQQGLGGPTKTICSDRLPFRLTFRSDDYEITSTDNKKMPEAMLPNKGLRLAYLLTAKCGT